MVSKRHDVRSIQLIFAFPFLLDVFTNEEFALNWIKHMNAEGVNFSSRQEEESVTSGSTDMGNVTYALPGIHAG